LAGSGVDVDAGAEAVAALPPKILNMTVPQVGHLPLMALRPFFIVSSTPSTISFLALHLTQYPSGIEKSSADASCAVAVNGHSLGSGAGERNTERNDGKTRSIRLSDMAQVTELEYLISDSQRTQSNAEKQSN
jgi:hypothetical protein